MPDLIRLQNFNDGDLVTAQKLKNLIDNSSIDTHFITSKPEMTQEDISSSDQLLVYDVSGFVFKKVSIGSTQTAFTSLSGRDYGSIPADPNYNYHNLYSTTTYQGLVTYAGIFITPPQSGESSGIQLNNGGFPRPIGKDAFIQMESGSTQINSTSFEVTTNTARRSEGYIPQIVLKSTNANAQTTALEIFDDNFRLFQNLTRANPTTGEINSSGEPYTVDVFETSRKVVDNKVTDTVLVTIKDEVSCPKITSGEFDSPVYKKNGTASVFPLKIGYNEKSWGSEWQAYTGVQDSVFRTGYAAHNSFRVDALVSGGFLMWETSSAISLKANEVLFLTLDIFHHELSTQAAAWIDYRLRLKAKTVGGATYPQKEIAVRRQQIASGQGTANHRITFRILRSDFPAGSEDITRQLEVQFTEANIGIAYRYFEIRATAELWNKSDIDAGTTALL